MTENDIKGNVAAIRELHSKLTDANALPPAERETIQTLVTCALFLLEGFLVDINRIANSLEHPQ